jgi:glutamate/tyrosine decarboxylase-like PLP-dependent enzyme
MSKSLVRLPATGTPKDAILQRMHAMRQNDVKWREGKAFSLVYHPGPDAYELLKEAYNLFFSENALNPTAFPSLRRMEAEVVGMTAHLLGGDGGIVENMTSGGTESILMAVKTARDWARANRPDIHTPELIVPLPAHPAFDKASHYFDVKIAHYPLWLKHGQSRRRARLCRGRTLRLDPASSQRDSRRSGDAGRVRRVQPGEHQPGSPGTGSTDRQVHARLTIPRR